MVDYQADLDFVKHFISSLDIDEGSNEYRLALVLFKTLSDCQDFYLGFYANNSNITDDLLDYREKKISLNNTSLDAFLWLCGGVASIEVFEQIFLQPFDNDIINLINSKIEAKSIDLEYIYESFCKNPNQNILKLIL